MANGHGGAREGAGRKPKDEELKEIALWDDNVSPEDWGKVARSVRDKAIKGDMSAAKLMFERRYGKIVEIKTDEKGFVQVIFAPHDTASSKE